MRKGSARTPTDGGGDGGADGAVVTAILQALRPRSLRLPPSASVRTPWLLPVEAASVRVARASAAAATNDHVRAAVARASPGEDRIAPRPLPRRVASPAYLARFRSR